MHRLINPAFVVVLSATASIPRPVFAIDMAGEAVAYTAYVLQDTLADRLVPDFVVKFRIPAGARWSVEPQTERARATLAASWTSAKTEADQTVVKVVAGGRARRAGRYRRLGAWAYANELRVRYRLSSAARPK